MDLVFFPGEKRLLDAPANLLVGLTLDAPSEPVTSRFEALVVAAKSLGSFVHGSAIGGHLALTTHRFFFASHGANTTRGECSIFLPTIVRERSVDGFLSDTLTLETAVARHELVVRKAPPFRGALARARETGPSVTELAEQVRARPDACGRGARALLGDTPSYDALTAKLAATSKGVNALDLLCAVNVAELLRRAA